MTTAGRRGTDRDVVPCHGSIIKAADAPGERRRLQGLELAFALLGLFRFGTFAAIGLTLGDQTVEQLRELVGSRARRACIRDLKKLCVRGPEIQVACERTRNDWSRQHGACGENYVSAARRSVGEIAGGGLACRGNAGRGNATDPLVRLGGKRLDSTQRRRARVR